MNIERGSRLLVVGGSSGMGQATAARAANAGAMVTIASRSESRLAHALRDLPAGVSAQVLDVTDPVAVQRFFAGGELWEHVIIAGSETSVGPVRSLPLADAYAAMMNKFWGAYHVAKFANFATGGSLTLVSGVYSVRPSKQAVLQGAINAALEGLTRGLALELAPVRVNVVSPGLTATPLWDRLDPDTRTSIFREKAAQLPAGRIAQSEDIADAILFAATNPFCTGATVLMDGGDALV